MDKTSSSAVSVSNRLHRKEIKQKKLVEMSFLKSAHCISPPLCKHYFISKWSDKNLRIQIPRKPANQIQTSYFSCSSGSFVCRMHQPVFGWSVDVPSGAETTFVPALISHTIAVSGLSYSPSTFLTFHQSACQSIHSGRAITWQGHWSSIRRDRDKRRYNSEDWPLPFCVHMAGLRSVVVCVHELYTFLHRFTNTHMREHIS